MRVQLLNAVFVREKGAGKSTPLQSHAAGEILDLDDAVAIDLLRSKRALAAPENKREAAVVKASEKAVKADAKSKNEVKDDAENLQ